MADKSMNPDFPPYSETFERVEPVGETEASPLDEPLGHLFNINDMGMAWLVCYFFIIHCSTLAPGIWPA